MMNIEILCLEHYSGQLFQILKDDASKASSVSEHNVSHTGLGLARHCTFSCTNQKEKVKVSIVSNLFSEEVFVGDKNFDVLVCFMSLEGDNFFLFLQYFFHGMTEHDGRIKEPYLNEICKIKGDRNFSLFIQPFFLLSNENLYLEHDFLSGRSLESQLQDWAGRSIQVKILPCMNLHQSTKQERLRIACQVLEFMRSETPTVWCESLDG
jgi:hypothetical protein